VASDGAWGGNGDIDVGVAALHGGPPEEAGLHVRLDPGSIEILRRYGTEHAVDVGETLFADGDVGYDLIVLLDGSVDIVQGHGQPNEVHITTYGPLEFLGEMSLLTGQRVYLTAVSRAPGRVLRIPVAQLRTIMDQEASLSELFLRGFLVRHSKLTHLGSGLTLIGSRFDVDTRRLLEVLARNRLPSRWLELEASPEAETILRQLRVPIDDLPIVMIQGGSFLRNPSSRDLLGALGMIAAPPTDSEEVCDLLVLGGGPGGLAAAVYGASEGMTTTLAEDTALGGQAGTSSRIENYLGFPAGLSGEELAARAALQAQKFGVRIRLAARAVSLSSEADVHRVHFDNGVVETAKSVIIATGARYNRLALDRLSDFEGVGVYYAATQMEAQACVGGHVVVVGGGNSAGQAALFLSRTCRSVHMVIRSESLDHSMSRYLIDQIEREPRISLQAHTEVVSLLGQDELAGVRLQHTDDDTTSELAVCGLFVFIGATPSTTWLDGQLAEDKDGFLLTGTDIAVSDLEHPGQIPLLLETSRPGVFCVGDVRSRSVKRAATAIGEGAMAVRLVFDRLQATGLVVADPPRAEGGGPGAAAPGSPAP
jgi:thioredoxin reductase (NADPH)